MSGTRLYVLAVIEHTTRQIRIRGQFVALCWIAQIHHHIDDPKPAYVAPWEALPPWQQDTDAHIFDVIEHRTLAIGLS